MVAMDSLSLLWLLVLAGLPATEATITCLSSACTLGTGGTCSASDYAGTGATWTAAGTGCYTSIYYLNGAYYLGRGVATNGCSSTSECAGSFTYNGNNKWEKCCTTASCNNVAIPQGITSAADLQKCYLGSTQTDCLDTTYALQSTCPYIQTTCVSTACTLGTGGSCGATDYAGTGATWTAAGTGCYTSIYYISGEYYLGRGVSLNGCSSTSECAGSFTYNGYAKWEKCCTTTSCNNKTIPQGITSAADLQNCYLGLTQTDCLDTNYVQQSGCPYVTTTTQSTTKTLTTSSGCLTSASISQLIVSAEQRLSSALADRLQQNQAAQIQILQALNSTVISQMQNP